jgi:hypothetical protein
MGLPGYLRGCFPVLPGWGVRCSRSYREGGQRTSLPISPATAAKRGKAKRRAHSSRLTIGRMTPAYRGRG